MSRIHIGLLVNNIAKSKQFYSTLFGEDPVVEKADYAKWTPSKLQVNFTITERQDNDASDAVHFGIEAPDNNELAQIITRLEQATDDLAYEDEAVCCYHKSKKAWGADADAFLWEAFATSGQHDEYGENNQELKSIQERALQRSEPTS